MSNIDTLLLGLCPRLVVGDGAAAIDFYGRALGAQARERFTGPENRIVHALLAVGPVLFSVKDAGYGDPAPTSGGVPVILALEVTDADSVADRMLAAGATVVIPVGDRPYGQRDGRLTDPFGHLWMISQQVEDLTAEQIQARSDAMFADGGPGGPSGNG